MINQAPIVRYTASVSEKFFPNSWRKTFSAESLCKPDPEATLRNCSHTAKQQK